MSMERSSSESNTVHGNEVPPSYFSRNLRGMDAMNESDGDLQNAMFKHNLKVIS